MLCKGIGYPFKLFILIQFPRWSEESEFKDWSCSLAYFALSDKKQWCRNWKLMGVQAVTDCWPYCNLVRDRKMLHKSGQASNCLNLSVFYNKNLLNIFEVLPRAKQSRRLWNAYCMNCSGGQGSVQRSSSTTSHAGQEREGSKRVSYPSIICH